VFAGAFLHALDAAAWAHDCFQVDLDDWQADSLRAAGAQLLLCSRQSGKSHTVALKALHHMLFTPNAMIIAASPTEDQSKELFRKLTGFYDRLPHAPRTSVRNTTELELATGARCCAVPGSERTIRSKSAVTLLIIDEASRIDDSLISAVTPMLATTDGDLLALSTPFGKRGWFWEQWTTGKAIPALRRRRPTARALMPNFWRRSGSAWGPSCSARNTSVSSLIRVPARSAPSSSTLV
jgi:hypothetical protein